MYCMSASTLILCIILGVLLTDVDNELLLLVVPLVPIGVGRSYEEHISMELLTKIMCAFTICLDNILGEKRKKGKERERKGREEKGKREKKCIVCIGRKRRGKKIISFSFQIVLLTERFGRQQNEGS